MTLHGSTSANLSPILFKGNNRALGVNVLIHQDQSGSMSNFIEFYSNGTFIGTLQDALLEKKIGDDISRYPNLYAYFDLYGRNASTSFTIANPNGSLLINQTFMRGEITGSATINRWISSNYFSNRNSHYVNICSNIIGSTIGGRLPNKQVSQARFSEDVHGNLWSIFTSPNAISTGTAGRFGSIIGSNVRKGSTTIIITNSDEQGNAPGDMINVPVSVLLSALVNPVCISVIDKSGNDAIIRNSWITFRNQYPNSVFYLLQPGGPSRGNLNQPLEFTNDPLAFGPITVNRDNGDVSRQSDWFEICNLGALPAGSVVSLAIDNSGSMTTSTVQASINLLIQRCNAAGITLIQNNFSDENWPAYHNTYQQRTINGPTGEMVFRNYRVIALSSYRSSDGFDGVLFYGSTSTQPYGYVTFTSNTTYTITRSTTAPNWRPPRDQKHDTLTLASETRGGLFKISNVFRTGQSGEVDRRVAFSRCLAEFITDTV